MTKKIWKEDGFGCVERDLEAEREYEEEQERQEFESGVW